jgi:hypothetical protein
MYYLPHNAYSVTFVFLVLKNLALLGEGKTCAALLCADSSRLSPVLCTENNFLNLGTLIKIVNSVKTSFVSCRGDLYRQSEVACSHCDTKIYGIL